MYVFCTCIEPGTAGRMHCFDLRMRVAHIAYFARIYFGLTQQKFLVAGAAR